MKKELIINGVDVSECPYIDKYNYMARQFDLIKCCNYGLCKDNPTCLFKRYQLKIAECNDLRQAETCGQMAYKYLEREHKAMTEQCEELKRKLEAYEKAGGNITLEKLWHDSAKKYEQALDSIKDLCCEKIKNCTGACFVCPNECRENKIINIINRVKK